MMERAIPSVRRYFKLEHFYVAVTIDFYGSKGKNLWQLTNLADMGKN